MSKFKLNYRVNATNNYYPSQNPTARQIAMMQALADNLSDEEYHELAHQLHHEKAEFDNVDGEFNDESDMSKSMKYKKYQTVVASLYRGIFWQTLEALDDLDDE